MDLISGNPPRWYTASCKLICLCVSTVALIIDSEYYQRLSSEASSYACGTNLSHCFCVNRLYNKESLLLALLDKPSLPEVARHIRSLRDVVELNLTPNPTYKAAAMAMAEVTQSAEFVCPVSGLEMSGRHRWVFQIEHTMLIIAPPR